MRGRAAERLSLRLVPQDVIHLSSGLGIGTRMSVNLYKVGSERLLSLREEHALSTASLIQITHQAMEALHALMEASRRPA